MKRFCAARCAQALAAAAVALSSPAFAVETVFNVTGTHSSVDGGCVGPTPVFSGVDCSWDASSPVIGGLPWAGPGFAAGYYDVGSSPFVVGGLGTEPAPGDGKIATLAVTGTLTLEDNGSACDTDDTIAIAFDLDAATRAFAGGPGTRGEESWDAGDVTYTIDPTSVDAAAANGAGGCDYTIASAGVVPPLLERTDGLGTGFFPPEESIDMAGFYVAPGAVGVASFEGNPNIGAPINVVIGPSWSCVESPSPGAGPCNVMSADPDDDGASFGGSRGLLENGLLAMSTDSGGNITSGVLYAFNESKIFNVPPDPVNSWDGPIVQFTAAGGGGGPVAACNDVMAGTLEDTTVNIDVLAGCSGFGGAVTVEAVQDPSDQGGTVTTDTATVAYTPAMGFSGTDTFTFTAGDGTDSVVANVSVDVQSDLQPTAADQTISLDTVGVDPSTLTGSFDAATATGNSPGNTPATASTDGGSSMGTDSASGSDVEYVPDDDFFEGADSFAYTITDANGDMATANVTVDIPDATPALGDANGNSDGDPVTVNPAVTAGNGAPSQHTLSISSNAANGSCVANADLSVTYTPDAGFSGDDQCTATLADGDGSTDDGVVVITVDAAGDITIKLPGGGSSALDLLTLSLLLGLPLLRRRRRNA